MKKTLIAFAALSAIAGMAQAQSSVTLYGIADAYVGSNFNTVRARAANAPVTSTTSTKTRQAVVDSGGLATSRFGMRGSEDLGGGLKAVFVLEGGLNVDTGVGNESGGLFGRQAYVGLNGGFGTATLGRHLTAYDALRGSTNYGGNALLFSLSQINQVWSNGVVDYNRRASNSFLYASPSFGGFSGSFLVGTGEDKAPGRNASRNNSFHLKYANGPLLVGYAFQQEKFNLGTTINAASPTTGVAAGSPFLNEREYNLVAGSYDLGVLKLNAGFQASKDKVTNAKDKELQVGVTVPFGAADVTLGYVASRPDNGGLNADGVSLFSTYNLSKRTAVYAGGITQKYDLAPVQAAGTTSIEKRSVLAVGVRHLF